MSSSVADMYDKCGALVKAQEVFHELPLRDVVCWNTLISGYTQHGFIDEALTSFNQMRNEGITPDAFILASVLKACANIKNIEQGKRIHDEIVSRALLVDKDDMVLGNALLDMYAKCGLILEAEDVHKGLPHSDLVTWNALLSGYVLAKQDHQALGCFDRMHNQGLSPDIITFTCILKACGGIGAIDKGKQIHNQIVTRCLLNKDVLLGTALVDMYAKCGALTKAQQMLDELPLQHVVSWNALIAGYAQQGQCHEALQCFKRMQSESLYPDSVTFICILKACGSAGAIDKGNQIHNEVVLRGLLEKDIAIGNVVVDMYAKCGVLAKAHEVLEELPVRDAISWNSLIGGYAEQGKGGKVLDCFEQMQLEGISPDEGTFRGVLSACSHSGLLAEAQFIFQNMAIMYGITPNLEHYTCMVVVFGYTGYFDKVASLIEVMPCFHYHAVWLALLGCCEKWGNVKLGTFVFDQVLQLDDVCTTAYVLMANIFATAGMHEDAETVVKYMLPQ
mgnify:CR=1 FL=1